MSHSKANMTNLGYEIRIPQKIYNRATITEKVYYENYWNRLYPFFCFLYSIAPLFKYLDLIDDLNDLPPEEQAFFARLWARHRINTEQLNTSGPPAMAQGGPTPTSSLVPGKFHCMVHSRLKCLGGVPVS